MKWLLSFPLAFIGLIAQSVALAMSQIWANKVRSILTTLGIIIGVASVTAVVAALSGLKAKVMSDIETFGTNRIFIWPRWPDSGPKKNASWRVIRFVPEQFEGLLDECPSVKAFTRVAGTNESVRHAEKALESAQVVGIEPAWHEIESRPVIWGRPFSAVDMLQRRAVCLVDPMLRDKLGMDRDPVGSFLTIGYRTFRVVGVVEPRPSMSMIGGGGRGEDYEVFIPFQTFYQIQGEPWFQVMAASRSPTVSEEAKAEITFFLRRTRNLKPGEPDTFRVLTVESEVRTFLTIAGRFTMVAAGVVGISLLVGGIGIMNIMLVSVSERTREIGLRKAVGATNAAILTQFLVEAVVLCCVGGLFGLGLGHVLTTAIARIPAANLDQAYIPGWAVLMSFGFSALVGIFFGMFPAAKAARLDPIEALRHE
ncbi:MAG TPA: FtsX-like permease family protein [Halothiobacillaceae bacterium]|nr:FtsX-like permease family protein [Halothiobacillaceae bacterium]